MMNPSGQMILNMLLKNNCGTFTVLMVFISIIRARLKTLENLVAAIAMQDEKI